MEKKILCIFRIWNTIEQAFETLEQLLYLSQCKYTRRNIRLVRI